MKERNEKFERGDLLVLFKSYKYYLHRQEKIVRKFRWGHRFAECGQNIVYVVEVSIDQWWRTCGTPSPLCWHACQRWHSKPSLLARVPSLQYRVRYQKGRGAYGQVAPKVVTAAWEDTTKARRTNYSPMLNQEHPLTQHVTSEIIPFDNITLPLAKLCTTFSHYYITINDKMKFTNSSIGGNSNIWVLYFWWVKL